MVNSGLPVATQAASSVLAEATKSTNSTFSVLYFALHGRGELVRTLLAYSGAKWNELPVDWANQKALTPFKVLPVVYETTSNGTILELAESLAIERYLARKFNLLGSNAWEENLVNEYVTSVDGVLTQFGTKILNSAPENRVEEANKIYKEVLPKWIAIQEEHLAKNGSNGHFVGNTATLADLKAALLIDRLLLLVPKGAEQPPFSAEHTPGLWKVRQTVNSHPSLAAFHKTERYQELSTGTKRMFKFE